MWQVSPDESCDHGWRWVLGSYLVETLLASGRDVRVFYRWGARYLEYSRQRGQILLPVISLIPVQLAVQSLIVISFIIWYPQRFHICSKALRRIFFDRNKHYLKIMRSSRWAGIRVILAEIFEFIFQTNSSPPGRPEELPGLETHIPLLK